MGKTGVNATKSDSEDDDEDDDEDEDDDNSEDDESSNDKNKTKSKGVKSFFKNLINFSKLTDKRKNDANNKKKENKINIVKTIVIVEKTDLKHRFLTVKNKNPDLFKDYRENQTIKSLEEFRLKRVDIFLTEIILILFYLNRLACKQVVETQSYEQLNDFYCWIFSKSSNLIELLVTDKANSKTSNEPKRHDASFYVTTNWKFMKEIYYNLIKMVFTFKNS